MIKLIHIITNVVSNRYPYRIASKIINSDKDVLQEIIMMTGHLSSEVSCAERLYSLINNLESLEKCLCCDNKTVFRSTTKGYGKTCGEKKCVHTVQQQVIRQNNPVHHFQSPEFRYHYKSVMQQKYGSDNYFSSEKGKDRVKQKWIEKYGVDNPAKDPHIRKRISETWSKNSLSQYTNLLLEKNEQILDWRKRGYC